jgi:hypothetical protein
MMTLNPKKTKALKKAAKAPKNKTGAAKASTLRLVVRDQDLHNMEREAELIRLRQRVAALEANAKAKKPVLPPRHGAMWEHYEDEILRRQVSTGVIDFRIIGEKIGRTPFAVFARAIKAGLITEGNCYRIWEASVAPSPEEMAKTVSEFNNELHRLLSSR